jgi:cyclophilin family peptidyl-prolyl cis-trans isomerase
MHRLFARLTRRNRSATTVIEGSRQPRPAAVEALERRTLFALPAHVTSITADNRGEVIINTDRTLNPETVNTRSVLVFTYGPDGIPLTADDIKQSIKVSYTESNRQLRIRTLGLPAGNNYWVKLSARQIRTYDGLLLDGEFKGAGLRTGNNVQGGDLLMQSKRDTSKRPVARYYTNYGGINVTLFKDLTPITADNFLHYANEAAWDGTFIHRSVSDFVIQGGGFIVDTNNTVQQAHQEASILNEPGIPNTLGRIAMARIDDNDPNTTDDINSATNQWFFNLSNSNTFLDSVNGGFTAFGEVADNASWAVVEAIAALDKVNAGSPFNELPVNDADAVQDRGGSLDPAADVVSIRRVAILNKQSALIVPT